MKLTENILKQIPSIKKTLVFAYNKHEDMSLKNYVNFDQILEKEKMDETFERFEFNHPIYIWYISSRLFYSRYIFVLF